MCPVHTDPDLSTGVSGDAKMASLLPPRSWALSAFCGAKYLGLRSFVNILYAYRIINGETSCPTYIAPDLSTGGSRDATGGSRDATITTFLHGHQTEK